MRDHDDFAPARRCPPWCGTAHDDRLHPDDQHHQSAARRVGVITGRPTLEPDDHATPGEVVGRLVRRTDSDQTWVELVSDESRDVRLVVTLESAQRLQAVLDDVVTTARTP